MCKVKFISVLPSFYLLLMKLQVREAHVSGTLWVSEIRSKALRPQIHPPSLCRGSRHQLGPRHHHSLYLAYQTKYLLPVVVYKQENTLSWKISFLKVENILPPHFLISYSFFQIV